MKNQFFGDNRDLLKFDLVCEILHRGLVDRFFYVPMLTPDEEKKEEGHVCRHEAMGGSKNTGLLNFLDECIINEKKDIGQLEQYFRDCGIQASIYRKDQTFTHEDRQSYFDGITRDMLTGSLVLVDPDKGLEERESNSGNLLFSELNSLYEKMGDNSILMFTQRFPFEDMHKEYLDWRNLDIKEAVPGSQPISIDDMDSLIFFMTRNQLLQSRLVQMLGEYIKQYQTEN